MLTMQLLNDVNFIQRELDQLFNDCGFGRGQDSAGHWGDYHLHDTGEAFELEATLPGLDIAKLDISVLGRQLTVSGEYAVDQLPEDAKWHRRERRQGSFKRKLQLTAEVAAEQVVAEYRLGILRLKLPKAASALPKKISVNVV